MSSLWIDWVGPFGLMGIGAVLLFGQAIVVRRAERPWFRHRLWPTRERDQILQPGDELPARPGHNVMIRVDPSLADPPYEQIRPQLAAQVDD